MADAAIIYTQDFEGVVGPEWSSTLTEVTPIGGNRFLGRFGNPAVSLFLTDLPANSAVRVVFSLFVIDTWDGNDATFGPDVFDATVVSGPTLLHASFSNFAGFQQSFPDPQPGGSHPAYTGASSVDTLGYTADSVYVLALEYELSGTTLWINFSGSGLEGNNNETWGLDNVSVEIIPEPSSALMAALGLAVLLWRWRAGLVRR